MGKDGNTIEIEIDAAATVAAAKTAGEANAKLVKFDQALGLFRDNVGLVSKTTEDVATRMGDFNTILGKFADSLVTNLADMQTSVVQKIEPHLERELENMVNRVLNKVEAKTGTTGESRSRSEAKQGAAAPAVPVTPAGQRVGVSQDTDYKKPDYRIKENIVERIVSDLDEATGKQVERILTTRNTRVIKDDHDQYEDEEGNLVDKTSTITTHTSEVNKANKVIAEGAKVEKDRGIAIRKEITGALIGLHVMKVVSQYSQVFNAGFMLIAAAMGHLLNNLLLPMMPMFTQIAQVIHMIANVVTMLPMPIRQLLGAFIMFKAASMLAASMPFKDIKDGFGGIKSAMESSATGIQKFIKLLAGFVDFMMSGQGRGAVSWIGGGLGKVGGAIGGGVKKLLHRAGGGPVLGHGAYIVGEKGPEIFVPKTSGSIIPNHKIGRADGVGDVSAAPTGSQAPILPDIGSTLLGGAMGAGLGYMFTGSPLVAAGGGVLGAAAGASGADIIGTIAGGVGAMMSNDTVQGIMGGMHLLTNTLAAFLAPIAPMLGVIAGVVGVASGVRGGLGGGGDGGRTAETVATVGKAQLKQTAAMSYGVQNTVNAGTRGTSSSLMALLLRMNGCIKVAPCTPDAFGFTAAITSALPAALTLALAAAVGVITYKIITEGIMPPLALAGVIAYAIRTEGVVPDAVNKTATITYEIVKKGIEPIVESKTATITYNIIKNGVEPIARPMEAAITYTIKTVGDIPAAIGKSVEYVYNIVRNGTEPVAVDKTATLTYNIVQKGGVSVPTTGGDIPVNLVANANVNTDAVNTPTVNANANINTATVDPKLVAPTVDGTAELSVDGAYLKSSLEKVLARQGTVEALLYANLDSGTRARLQAEFDGYQDFVVETTAKINAISDALTDTSRTIDVVGNIYRIQGDPTIGTKVVDIVGNVYTITAADGKTLVLEGIDGKLKTIQAPDTPYAKVIVDVDGRVVSGKQAETGYTVPDVTARGSITSATLESGVKVPAVPVESVTFGVSGQDFVDYLNSEIAKAKTSGRPFTVEVIAEASNEYISRSGDAYLKAWVDPVYDNTKSTKMITIDAEANIVRASQMGEQVVIEVWAKDGQIKGITGAKTYVEWADGEPKIQTLQDILDKRLAEKGGLKVPAEVKPGIPEGFDWGGLARGAVGGLVVALGIAVAEYDTTGKIDWGKLFLGLGTAALAWTGAEYVLVSLATALAGAIAGEAVVAAFGAVGALLIPLILAPVAYMLGTEAQKTLQNFLDGATVNEDMFEGYVGKFAFRFGSSLGKGVDDWLKQNFKIDLSYLFQQDGPEGDMLRDMVGGVIGVTLGPDVAAKFLSFNNDLKTTLAAGVPVDVKIDTDSVTRTIESVASTVNPGGTYTYNPTGSTQPLGTNPTDASGTPIQGPLKPDGSFALGGSVAAGGTYLVGERGPELFVPSGPGEIVPNNKLGSLGGGGNVTVNQTFHVTTNNPRELTDTVMKELKMELARVKM